MPPSRLVPIAATETVCFSGLGHRINSSTRDQFRSPFPVAIRNITVPALCAWRCDMRRRAASLALLVGTLALPWSEPSAQDYPSRTVRMIVPLGAGGPTDLVARSLADGLSNSLKRSFVVENRPGARGGFRSRAGGEGGRAG